MCFNRFNSEKKYDSSSLNESLVRILVINFIGVYSKSVAHTGSPILDITIAKETVLKKVLFPAILAPVIIKNSSLFMVTELVILFSSAIKG